MKFRSIILGVIAILAVGKLKGDHVISVEENLNLDGLALGTPAMNGTGCTLGATMTVLDSQSKDLLVTFDDYMVEAWGKNHVSRKNCSLVVPLTLPAGVQVALVGTRFEGFNILPEGASSVLSSESFIAGTQGEHLTERFEGTLEEDFLVENTVPVETQSVSACGGEVNLRLNSSLRVRANSNGDYALAGISALGANASSLVQRLKFTKCE